MKPLQTLLLLTYILFTGCINKSIPLVDLQPDTTIYKYSDSSLFSDIRSIKYYNNKLYVSDYKRNQVVVLDTNLGFKESIGRKGEGPGEFNGLSNVYLSDDTLVAYNDVKRTLEKYFKSIHIETIDLPEGVYLKSNYKFLYADGMITFGHTNDTSGICCYTITNKSLQFFGTLEKKKNPKVTRIKNCRNILKYKNKIISVSDYRHVIEIYDTDHTLLNKFDYSDIDPAKRRRDYIDTQIDAENSYYSVTADVCINNDKLYLLLYSNNDDDVTCNTVLEFAISENKINPLRILNLGEGFFKSISVFNHTLISYNPTNGALNKYHMNQP